MKKKVEIAYHFTGDKLRDGRPIPSIGKWLVEKGKIEICRSGLHASRTPFQALSFAPGFQLHKVEVKDILSEVDDKLVARKRKILATIDAKHLILTFARKQALSVVHLFDCPPVLKEWLETGKDDLLKQAQADADANAYYTAANAAAYYAAKAADVAANAYYAYTFAIAADADAAANAAAYYAAKAADADANAYYAYTATHAAAYYAANAKEDFNKMVYEAFK